MIASVRGEVIDIALVDGDGTALTGCMVLTLRDKVGPAVSRSMRALSRRPLRE